MNTKYRTWLIEINLRDFMYENGKLLSLHTVTYSQLYSS